MTELSFQVVRERIVSGHVADAGNGWDDVIRQMKRKAWSESRRIVRKKITRFCRCCGKKFRTFNKKTFHCKVRCRWKSARDRRRAAKPILTRTCPFCRQDFTTQKANKVYCSRPHKTKAGFLRLLDRRRNTATDCA